MKSILLYICLLVFFLCPAHAMAKLSETTDKESDIRLHDDHNIEYGFICADGQSNQTCVQNQYIACKTTRVHRSKSRKILLSDPFIMSDHPQSLKNNSFFRAFLMYGDKFLYVPQKGELIVDTIGEKPVWCFEKKENRNLNYKVYLAPFYNQVEPSLRHILEADLIIFTPYFEKNGESYILTWNPIESVQDSVKADKRMILFPFCGEEGTRPGMVVSPLLFYNVNRYYVDIAGHIGDYDIVARLEYTIIDAQRKKWILSWRKVDKKTLQEHSKFFPHEIRQ